MKKTQIDSESVLYILHSMFEIKSNCKMSLVKENVYQLFI